MLTALLVATPEVVSAAEPMVLSRLQTTDQLLKSHETVAMTEGAFLSFGETIAGTLREGPSLRFVDSVCSDDGVVATGQQQYRRSLRLVSQSYVLHLCELGSDAP